MHIEFKQLTISNFLSFGDNVVLNLTDRGYVLVTGTNQRVIDNAGSNGSGKSALWEAMSWCLTGETLRGIKSDVVNMYSNASECSVKVVFNLDGKEYTVIRKDSIKSSGKLALYIDGEDKSGKGIKDTEKLLREYLPELTKDLLGSVIILGQGLPQRFSNNTPSGRKAVLEKLSKSDFMIEDIKDRLTKRLDKLNKDLKEISDTLISLNARKAIFQRLVDEDSKLLNQLPKQADLQKSIDTLTAQKSVLQNDVDTLDTELQKVRQIHTTKYEELTKLSAFYRNKLTTVKDEESEILRSNANSKSTYEAQIKYLRNEISRKESIRDVCPTCGQKLVGVVKPDTTEMHTQLNELQQKLNDITTQENRLTQQCEAKIASIQLEENQATEDLQRAINLNSITERQIQSTLTLKNQELQQILLKITQSQRDLQNYTSTKIALEERITNNKANLDDIGAQILYNNKNEEELTARISVVNKMLTIAKRDFRGYLLSNIIEYIDQCAKRYARDIFDNEGIDFKLDGNNLLIAYDSKPYENLSGGERQKIDIIVQFALRDMLCKFSAFSSNILVLDELFDGLDASGCQKVIDLIAKHLTDVESVFIITHHADIAVPADCMVHVIKNNDGVSFLK